MSEANLHCRDRAPTDRKKCLFRGEIGGRLFNFNGSVDVLADVVGYYSANVVTDFEVVTGVRRVRLRGGAVGHPLTHGLSRIGRR